MGLAFGSVSVSAVGAGGFRGVHELLLVILVIPPIDVELLCSALIPMSPPTEPCSGVSSWARLRQTRRNSPPKPVNPDGLTLWTCLLVHNSQADGVHVHSLNTESGYARKLEALGLDWTAAYFQPPDAEQVEGQHHFFAIDFLTGSLTKSCVPSGTLAVCLYAAGNSKARRTAPGRTACPDHDPELPTGRREEPWGVSSE